MAKASHPYAKSSNVQRGQIRFDGKLLAKSDSSFRMSNGDRFDLTQTIRKERLEISTNSDSRFRRIRQGKAGEQEHGHGSWLEVMPTERVRDQSR